MTGRDVLQDLRKMNTEIEALREQITLVRQEAEGLRSMEINDMPRGGVSPDMGDAVARLADLQRTRYDLTVERMVRREQAMLVIAKLDKSEQRTVLMMRYILGKSWDEIVDAMHYAYSGIFKLHGRALSNFDKEWSKVEFDL